MSEVTTVDTQAFEEVVLQSEVPVLVDFWAAWCGPCRAIAPVLDQIAAEQDGKLLIAKLNVDENPDIASRYNISSIPVMKVFDKGEIVREIIGAMPKPQIEQRLEGISCFHGVSRKWLPQPMERFWSEPPRGRLAGPW